MTKTAEETLKALLDCGISETELMGGSTQLFAGIQGGKITVATLGTDEVMLSGNLIAIFSSGIIH